MKRIIVLNMFCLALLCSSMAACASSRRGEADQIASTSKDKIVRTYKVPDFTGITSNVVGEIQYSQSTDGTTSVKVIASKKFMDALSVKVTDGVLNIKIIDDRTVYSNNKDVYLIEISSPDLNNISMNSVCDFTAKTKLVTNSLTISNNSVSSIKIPRLYCDDLIVNVNSTGTVEIGGKATSSQLLVNSTGEIIATTLDVDKLDAVVNSTGTITCNVNKTVTAASNSTGEVILKGTADEASYLSTSTGEVNAKQVKAKRVKAFCSGTGSISCYATEYLNANTESIGSIYYYGNPKKKDISKDGRNSQIVEK